MNEIAERVRNSFSQRFNTEPLLYFSPGRINLIGEHIDYNDGFVMPAAINKGVYYAIAANQSDAINFYSVDYDEHFSVALKGVQRSEGWKNYVLGVVNEFLLLGKPINGFDCVFAGDIPAGAGMSSSAAVEAGMAFSINELFDCGLDRAQLALLCQRAEHNYPGVKCGIMDMYASLHGKKDHVLLLDCKQISHGYFPLQLQGYKIVLLNSKVHHTLASGEYNVRRQRCEEGLAVLKKELHIHSFRDITDAGMIVPLKEKMKPEVYACCTYVVEEIQRTQKAAALLQQNDLTGFGRLMFETHEGLSRLYKVSCPELDLLAAQAKANRHVIGARMMGGGFGGCTINIVAEHAIDEFIEQVSDAYKKAFGILPEAYLVETGEGTGRIVG